MGPLDGTYRCFVALSQTPAYTTGPQTGLVSASRCTSVYFPVEAGTYLLAPESRGTEG